MADYKSKYKKNIDNITKSILNRDNFSYNMNADALYNMYKDQYMQQGNYDMRNAMGESAGMTGGMVSSAGITAGESAYQQDLNALNDKVPELYERALSKYNYETTDLQNKYNLLNQMDQFKYQQYRDKIADKQADRNYELQKMQMGL